MKLKAILIAWTILLAADSYAQQQAVPGRILFSIKPEAITVFRTAFDNPEIHWLKFDPQKFSLKDAKAITALLGLPSVIHVSSLKPFIPQHNIVLEELRERTNPILFVKTNQNGIAIKETEEMAKLRSSEEHMSRWFELFYDGSISPETAITFLKKSGIVECAEPRYRYSLCFTPNDPDFSQQYALPLMHVPEAWDVVRCDSTMLIADDDIGSDWTHSDLAKAVFINYGEVGIDSFGFRKESNGIDDDGDGFIDDWHGWDFAGETGDAPDNDPNTPAKHGTHTAGIMAASGNNNIGICGVAFGAKLLILKCGDNSGNNVEFGYEGIVFAADHGAKVVNNSWGGTNRSQVGQDIVDYATSKNCVVVAASGNSGVFQNLYPASYDHVLSVAAVDQSDNITSFSNYNPHVDLSAPGQSILSTVPNEGYETMTGTSMASPNAAGAVALVRQKFPGLTPDQVQERLRATTDPLTPGQDLHPGYTGKGVINVKRAVSTDLAYSARLQSIEIFDQNGNGSLESGEGADIVLHVENFLSPLSDLQATVEYLNDTGHAISANTQTVHFGKANTLSLVQNFQGSFHITVAPNAPNDYTILVKLTFNSTPENYGPDVDYFQLVINKGYLDLNKNNLTVTFDSKGGIGYNDAPNNMEGSGFVWTLAPPPVAIEGRDILSSAGLMIGVQDSIRIVSAAPGEYNDSYMMQDFASTLPILYVTPPDHSNAVQ
ncbi:MAG: S8 family serine peptidase, partial [Candidatus Kapaibacterium sp.]